MITLYILFMPFHPLSPPLPPVKHCSHKKQQVSTSPFGTLFQKDKYTTPYTLPSEFYIIEGDYLTKLEICYFLNLIKLLIQGLFMGVKPLGEKELGIYEH